MEMNVEKTKVMRISRQPSTVTIMIDQKQLENAEYFKYLGSILTYIYIYIYILMEHVRVKLNPGFPWKKLRSTRRRRSLQQIGLKFEEESSKMLHMEHGFVWC